MSLRKQVLSGIRWSASAKLLSQVITWAITLVVIRILTPSDYGLLAMATVFVQVAATFSELGLGSAVIQKSEISDQLLRRVFAIILLVHFFLAALLALAAGPISVFYGEPRLILVVQALSLQFVIGAFAVIPNAMLQRRMEFRNRSLLDLSSSISASLTTLGLALSGAGVWALVIGSTVGQLWRSIGMNFLYPFWKWPEFSLQGMRSLLRFGGHLTTAQIFGVYISQVDIIICAKLLGNEAVGFYSTAMHLASMPTQRVSAIVNQVAFPAFSSIQGDLVKISTHVMLGVRLLSFFAFPILWGLSSVSPELVEVVLGENWLPSIIPLQLLSLIMPLRLIGNIVFVAVQGAGRSDISLNNIVFASVIISITLFAGAQWGGLIGMCIGWIIASPITNLRGLMRSLPVLGLRLGEFCLALSPAISAAIMYGAVMAMRTILIDAGVSAAMRLPALIALGATTYLSASFALNRKGMGELFGILADIASPRRNMQ